ncbi:MAG: hypothetical protein H7325_09740 [Pedobacter sp.]|nr:hypothetical protein [Pedobacter sp.]
MKKFVLIMVFAFIGKAQALTVQLNGNRDIFAIGSISISNVLYDISFNGAFGTSKGRNLKFGGRSFICLLPHNITSSNSPPFNTSIK